MSAPAVVVTASSDSLLERRFKIAERSSTIRTEIVGGLVTFLTMSYIIFLNPSILHSVKDHNGLVLGFNQVATMTALVAGLLTIAMGLYANYPFAMASGLGLNAFVAFSLVGGPTHLTWPDAMGVIVMEGIFIMALVLAERRGVSIRQMVLDAIPEQLRFAIGIGIGLFITLIGLVNAGVVVKGEGTLVTLAPHYNTWPLVIFGAGLMITGAMVIRGWKAALLLGIVATTAFALIVNYAQNKTVFTDGSAVFPSTWSSPDFSLAGNFSFNFWSVLGVGSGFAIVLSVMLSDFFDTAGTFTALGAEAGLLDENGQLPDMKKALIVDSAGPIAGGGGSVSSNTGFIEAASGIAAGARTGLAALVVGVLFIACLGIAPVVGMVPAVATAPVLVVVGYYMMRLVKNIDWDNARIGIPALATIIIMPATYSITNGVGAGFIAYTLMSLLSGNARKVHPLMYVVSAVFGWYFYHGIVG
jgi:AGZA family xanthine/uracil permease-like MFS transporter